MNCKTDLRYQKNSSNISLKYDIIYFAGGNRKKLGRQEIKNKKQEVKEKEKNIP